MESFFRLSAQGPRWADTFFLQLKKRGCIKLSYLNIPDMFLNEVHQFTYLRSTISDNLSLDVELNKRIGKATKTLARLTTRVWKNTKLSTKLAINNAYVLNYCMAAKRGRPTPSRKGNSTPSTCAAFGEYFTSPGKTGLTTRRSSHEPAYPACTPSSGGDVCGGWATSAV